MFEIKLGQRLGNQIVAVYANDVVDVLGQLIGGGPLKLVIKAEDIVYIKPYTP